MSPGCRRRSATSQWCFSPTRCSRIFRSPRTSSSACACARSMPPTATIAFSASPECSACPACSIASRRSYRVDSSSASLSVVRSSRRRRFASWTSRSRISTRNCARKCAWKSAISNGRWASPWCTSRTIRSKRCRWQTGSYLLSNGRIEQNGAPADLYETPANIFVARFIGTPPMNLLKLGRGATGAVIAGTNGPRVAAAELSGATLGVRPEHVVIGGGGEAIAAQIEGIEYLGADSLLSCRVGSESLTARVAGRVGLRRGDTAQLGWAPGALHIFDGANRRTARRRRPSRNSDNVRLRAD